MSRPDAPYDTPARLGQWFWQLYGLDNSQTACWGQAEIVAFKAGAGPNGEDLVETKTGKFFVPKTPEVFSYDLDGNLLADGRWLYTWDSENRLIAMEGSAVNVGGATMPRSRLLFTYDPQSRRLQRRQYAWDESASDWTLTADTRYLYDGWNCVAEFDGSGALQARYVWGLDLSGTEQGAGGVSGLLFGMWSSPSFQGPVSSFYCYDGNGNVVALASTVDGALLSRYDYAPFGETLLAEDATGSAAPGLATLNPYRFSTKPQDPASHLYYYGYRWYSAELGRWLSRDPIEESGGVNVTCFCDNQSTGRVDMLGMASDYSQSITNEISTITIHNPCVIVILYGHGAATRPHKFAVDRSALGCSFAAFVGCDAGGTNTGNSSSVVLPGAKTTDGDLNRGPGSKEDPATSFHNWMLLTRDAARKQAALMKASSGCCKCASVRIVYVFAQHWITHIHEHPSYGSWDETI